MNGGWVEKKGERSGSAKSVNDTVVGNRVLPIAEWIGKKRAVTRE